MGDSVTVIKRGILKTFDRATYLASVQIVGRPSGYIESIMVAPYMAWTELVVGREVAVLFLDSNNPADAVVISVWDGLPEPGKEIAWCTVMLNIYFETFDGFSTGHSGSGTSTWAILNHTLRTGATLNSIAKTYTGTSLCGFYKGCRWASDISMSPLSNQIVYVGQFNPSTPTDICSHIGFKVVNGLIYASSGDSVNGKQTSTGYTAGSWETIWLGYDHLGTSINFYVQNVLVATHTEKYPNPGEAYSRTLNYIKTTATLDKQIQVRRIHMMQAGPY